jgi:hypothetical protein
MSKTDSNNRWFGRPRLFGLLLVVGFSVVVWCLVYLALSGRWTRQEATGASSQATVQQQDDDELAPIPAPDPVRTE